MGGAGPGARTESSRGGEERSTRGTAGDLPPGDGGGGAGDGVGGRRECGGRRDCGEREGGSSAGREPRGRRLSPREARSLRGIPGSGV